jgi:hypothetical protein
LCKNDEEFLNHLVVECPHAKEAWKEALKLSNGHNMWEKTSLLACFENWYNEPTYHYLALFCGAFGLLEII